MKPDRQVQFIISHTDNKETKIEGIGPFISKQNAIQLQMNSESKFDPDLEIPEPRKVICFGSKADGESNLDETKPKAAFFRAVSPGQSPLTTVKPRNNTFHRSSQIFYTEVGTITREMLLLLLRFLDAFLHLYERVCPSIGPSVRPSVCWLVRPSVSYELKSCLSAVLDKN